MSNELRRINEKLASSSDTYKKEYLKDCIKAINYIVADTIPCDKLQQCLSVLFGCDIIVTKIKYQSQYKQVWNLNLPDLRLSFNGEEFYLINKMINIYILIKLLQE